MKEKRKKNGPCPSVRTKNDKKMVSENPEKCGPAKNEKKTVFPFFFDTKVIGAQFAGAVFANGSKLTTCNRSEEFEREDISLGQYMCTW